MAAGRIALLALLLLTVAACSKALRWTPDTHTVRTGETVYSIALRYRLDYRELAAWNQLGDAAYIREGQVLRLRPALAGSAGRPSKPAPPALPAPVWRWPTEGAIAVGYGTAPKTQSGVRIAGTLGQPVVAVAAGEVVYAGDGLPSYGLLLIIKHNSTWLSAYGFNSKLRVREGERVAAGQAIAQLGQTRPGEHQLHFEIRRNGQPVDPVKLLPAR